MARRRPYRKAAPPGLVSEIASQSSRPVPPVLSVLVESLEARFGESLRGVLLYGSCLHNDDPTDGIVDLYAIVDDYRNAYPESYLRAFNAWLPPNVFYVEEASRHPILRAKYAVISMEAFEEGASRWFHSYIWARFAQPVRVLYARDEESRSRIHEALAQAVLRFLGSCIPALDAEDVDAAAIWTRGLTLSYASELRAEKGRAGQLADTNLEDYARLTASAAPGLQDGLVVLPHLQYRRTTGERERRRALRHWRLRRWQGRILSILRLSKAVFTFRDSVDYAAWKIERHTGVAVDVTPRLKRFPLLLGPVVLWRLLRRGTLR